MIEFAQYEGNGHPQEDSYFEFSNENMKAVTIFDGHGKNGAYVSGLCVDFFKQELGKIGGDLNVDEIAAEIHKIFINCDRFLYNCAVEGGTTASLVLYSYVLKQLFVANVGDSLIMLRYQDGYILCSGDDAPENIDEYRRMREQIGKDLRIIAFAGHDQISVYEGNDYSQEYLRAKARGRLEQATVRGDPLAYVTSDGDYMLAMTRALGDFALGNAGVIATPHIKSIPLDNFSLIVASDGVWDHWQYDEISAYQGDARSILAETSRRAKQEYSYDDATICTWNQN